jgi:hypothetical protein
MVAFTCDTLTTKALRLIGKLRPRDVLNADDSATGFDAANDMLDGWAAQRLTVYQTLANQYTLLANRGGPVGSAFPPYLIGIGSPDFNQVRPEWIYDAHLILTNSTPPIENPDFVVFREDEYERISAKTLTSSIPKGMFYDHAFPTTGASAGYGNIFLYPVPNGSQPLALVIYTPTPLSSFLDPNTTPYLFPPGYAEALRYQLAIRLAGEYGMDPPAKVNEIAALSFGIIKRPNVRIPVLRTDLPKIGGGGSIFDWRMGVNR